MQQNSGQMKVQTVSIICNLHWLIIQHFEGTKLLVYYILISEEILDTLAKKTAVYGLKFKIYETPQLLFETSLQNIC
jgi:hypothetical protein